MHLLSLVFLCSLLFLQAGCSGDANKTRRATARADTTGLVSTLATVQRRETSDANRKGRKKRRARIGSFELPFLGRIQAEYSTQRLEVPMKDGPRTVEFRVFRDANGNFLRAEYGSENVPRFPADAVQRSMESGFEKIVGLAKQHSKITFRGLLEELNEVVSWSDVTRMEINYVHYWLYHEPVTQDPPRDMFVVNVWGMNYSLGRGSDDRKVRFLLDASGNAIFADNRL